MHFVVYDAGYRITADARRAQISFQISRAFTMHFCACSDFLHFDMLGAVCSATRIFSAARGF